MTPLTPPRCIETEQTLLAACMVEECAPPCPPEDFSSEKTIIIARAMHDLSAARIKPDLVMTAEKVASISKGKVAAADVAFISEFACSSDNIETYAEIVKKTAAARRAQARAAQFVSEMSEPKGKDLSAITSEFSSDLLRICDTGSTEREVTMKEGISSFLVELDRRMSSHSGVIGIPTYIPKLDMLTCGMCAQDLWVIAGRPSMGKTALSLQIVAEASENGTSVLFFSLDMRREALIERFLCRKARIEMQKIRSGQLTGEEYTRLAYAAQLYAELPITITDVPATELDIAQKARKIRPGLIVVDYLTKVIPVKRSGSTNDVYGEVSKAIKNVAKELEIPVLLLAQMNRDIEKEKRAPRCSDLRDTGQIEQDADIIMFVHQVDNNKMLPTRTIVVDKQRQGECAYIDMAFIGKFQSFETLDVRY